MNKQIYLIRGPKEESYKEFTERMILETEKTSNDLSGSYASLTVTDRKPPAVSVIPFKKTKIAAVSISTEKENPSENLIHSKGFSGAYLVEEALPIAYKKTWKNGKPTPGICLLTLFRKKKNLEHKVFLDRWHNGHTPLTLKVHPIYHYNRNVITKKLTEDSEPHDGIVEEHVKKPSLLFNPAKFFGGPLMMPVNMIRVYFDVRSFLDYGSVEPYLVREFVVK